MSHTKLGTFVKLTEINFRLIHNSPKVSYQVSKMYTETVLLLTKFWVWGGVVVKALRY